MPFEHTRKPWEMVEPDEDIIPVWERCATREFYYATGLQIGGKTLVFVVPADFFNAEGLMYGWSMPIVPLIPMYLQEISPSIYETSLCERQASLDMLQRGFIHDNKFQDFIEKSGYPYPKV